MDIFIKATACVLIALLVYIILQRQGKDFSIALSLTVCVMIAVSAIQLLSPVMEMIEQIIAISNIDRDLVAIILKVVGIGLISEIAVLICNDAGNASMGKTLQILATAAILVIAVPLFTGLIELFNSLLLTT